MSNTYITIVDGEYKKAKAPDVPQPWKPTMPEAQAGGGLPDPSSYSDGTVLIKVGSEWKAQSGYGYEGEPAFEPIEWDGDTTGKEAATTDGQPFMYKVSDDLLTANGIVGSNVAFGGTSMTITEEYVEAFDDAVIALYVFSGKAGIYDSEVLGVSLSVPEDGTYFYNADGMSVSSLTAPSSVTTIDPKFIPGGGEFVVTYRTEDEVNYSCDKSFDDIVSAFASGENVTFKLDYLGVYYLSAVHIENGNSSIASNFVIFVPSSNAMHLLVVTQNGNGITASSFAYTLTPASQE